MHASFLAERANSSSPPIHRRSQVLLRFPCSLVLGARWFVTPGNQSVLNKQTAQRISCVTAGKTRWLHAVQQLALRGYPRTQQQNTRDRFSEAHALGSRKFTPYSYGEFKVSVSLRHLPPASVLRNSRADVLLHAIDTAVARAHDSIERKMRERAGQRRSKALGSYTAHVLTISKRS